MQNDNLKFKNKFKNLKREDFIKRRNNFNILKLSFCI